MELLEWIKVLANDILDMVNFGEQLCQACLEEHPTSWVSSAIMDDSFHFMGIMPVKLVWINLEHLTVEILVVTGSFERAPLLYL